MRRDGTPTSSVTGTGNTDASWSGLPIEGVVRVVGAGRAELAVALDADVAAAPAVVGCGVDPHRSAAESVDDVIDHLTSVATALFPAWLPGAENVDGAGSVDRALVRRLATGLASITDHYGPFIAAVADAAVLGRPPAGAFAPETRLRGLARILRSAYRRQGLVVLLDTSGTDGGHAGSHIATAAAWLADHGGVGVWLVGQSFEVVDRFPSVTPDLPGFVARLPRAPDAEPPLLDYPAVLGRPHPLSAAETCLESRLRGLPWARDRVWNQVHQSHPLAPPIRVDLMWPQARCVVEIDGPDHRGVLKYADDRRRDNTLVLDGYAVLRFTNDEIRDDAARVLHTIERLVTTRRPQKGEAQ